MVVQTPLLGFIAIIGCFLVFTLPQLFQAAAAGLLTRMFGSQARLAVLLALPLTTILTWYSYEYLTPSDWNLGINVGAETACEHGISSSRYLSALMFQAPATLFSFLHLNASFRKVSKIPLLLATLALTIVISEIYGFSRAQNRIRLLDGAKNLTILMGAPGATPTVGRMTHEGTKNDRSQSYMLGIVGTAVSRD